MKISFRQRLIIFASLILLINGFIGYAVYKSKQKLIDSELWVQHTEDVILKSENILSLGKDIESASRGFVITNDSAFLEPLFIAEKIIFQNIQQLGQLIQDNPVQQQRLDSINFYIQKRLEFSLQQVELRSNHGLNPAIALTSTNQGMYYSDRMRQITTILKQEEIIMLKQRKQTNERSVLLVNLISAGMFILMTVFTLFLLFVTGKYLLQIKEKERLATELIIVNEDRRETNEYLENLLDYANAPIIVWNMDYKITRFNKAFEALTGRTEKDVIGQSLEILFPSVEKDNSMKLIRKTLKGEWLDVVEINILHIDGSVRILLWNSANIMSPNGKTPMATIAQGNDITERKMAEKEIKKMNETLEGKVIQLEAANKELEAFSYSISHDLRAPLRHIGGFIDLLIKNNSAQLNDSGLRFLNIISESSKEMGNLIDALLAFSRLGRSELQGTKINTKTMVSRVLDTFTDELAARNVEIRIAELPDSWGDENLLNQVWINLISNALKYSKNTEKAVIEIGGKMEDDKTIYYVKDNGVGFDMKYADKLFGVFQRLHKAKDFEGIGIGLANVNRIVMRHGGNCWAESEINKGTTFFFSNPINHN
ncbi:MAG: CHASE3 domain-containing protein [Bacteroidales bacterium]|nr:CHASE3 domain-containing protein [Bacteroidales bacterium]